MVPAMQIHLFDCKSTNPLLCGLGSNKLHLCMLVLSNLRDTYWSAGVMYRLFERAQLILGHSNPAASKAGKTPTAESNHPSFNPGSQPATEIQQAPQRQQHQEREVSMLPTPETNIPISEQAAPLWLNGTPYFSAVDQLLSPGFALSENNFQTFFAHYDDSAVEVYDPIGTVHNEEPIDLLYNV
jgi:hypothetical protein